MDRAMQTLKKAKVTLFVHLRVADQRPSKAYACV
jgi:hypothetical protein